ncbi:MAG: topoisomerase C-terminal repeat-containing protein, partial [Brevibacillus sp.]
AEIGQGLASPQAFMEQVKKLSSKIVQDAVEQSQSWNLDGYDVAAMPRQSSRFSLGKKVAACRACGGDLVDKGDFYGCANYRKTGCGVTLSKTILGKKISAANVKRLMESGRSNLIKGFQKGEERFDAYLLWDDREQKVRLQQNAGGEGERKGSMRKRKESG